MAHRQWHTIVGLVVVSTLASWNDALAREQGLVSEPVVAARVRIENRAGVDGATLALAKARTSDVFSLAGVHIDWADADSANSGTIAAPYTVLIMADAPATVKAAAGNLKDGLMGQAAPFIGRAYVYYDGVLAETVPLRGPAITLGDVIAHELGHLLLGSGHSSHGIMRSHLDRTTRRVETFREGQAAAIKQRLRLDVTTNP